MGSDNVIHLIILVESSHDAEVLSSTFRNVGYAVRSQHVEDCEELAQTLNDKSWDLLITAPRVGDCTASQALEEISKAGKDIPVIVFGDHPDKATTVELLRAGAAACIGAQDQEHLLIAVGREYGNLLERRRHRRCKVMLTESEKRNRVLLDSSRDAIAYIHEGMHIYANLSYLEMFHYDTLEEIESVPILDMIAGENQKEFKELLRTLSKGETPEQDFEFNVQPNEGEPFSAIMKFSPASIEGESCTQVVILRHSDSKDLEKELDQLRKQDLLTGLYNRQHFMDELKTCVSLATRGQLSSVLLYLEPDKFKNIKDTVGIAASDLVLSDMASILRNHVPPDTILARFAGTIFTAIFPDNTLDDVKEIAEKIRAYFEQHIFEVEGKSVTTTCSIGITPISETTEDARKTISQADAACAIAKKENGNKIHVHTIADQIASIEEERAWAERIKTAIKNNLFVLHFQPIVSLHAEPGERYEVLLRLKDKNNQLTMPSQFLPAAENAQMMAEIDRWVMKNAAKVLLEKRKDGKELRFFIKLSLDSLIDATLLPWLSKLLKAARLHGNCFVFEVNETAALQNLKATKTLVSGLKQLHCLFALDHVSNEDEGLAYLSQFPVDYLKIDGGHIQSIINNENSQQLVKSITEKAREHEVQTIAEHVQDPACLAVLWQHGVNFIQGFYLQKPEHELNYDFSSDH